MDMIMCRSCGEFVTAFPDGDALEPSHDECPECGGTEFKDTDLDRAMHTEEVSSS